MSQDEVLVTGAGGFVGGALCRRLVLSRLTRGTVRKLGERCVPDGVKPVLGFLSIDTDWSASLAGVGVVVHCAGRVHVMQDDELDPLTEFRGVNVEGTLALARQSAAAGVRRFVFVSSIKVNGESTLRDKPFRTDDVPAPVDPYGTSKMEAEYGLRQISVQTGMEVVIVRPPLVYGPGVKANFLVMMSWLRKGAPLPLGAIHNKRSLVGLDNLVDLLVICMDHPAAANQMFLVSDGEDMSTTQLLRRMGDALGKPARLLPVPVWMIETGAALIGKRDLSQRLCGNLQVVISNAKELLGWSPPVSVDESLRRVAADFLQKFGA